MTNSRSDKSPPSAAPAIVVSAADRERLLALLAGVPEGSAATAAFLRRELERAEVIEDGMVSRHLVVMGSTVGFVEQDSHSARCLRLAYPDEATDGHSISVLSPLGAALLGLGPGQSITWRDANRDRTVTVLWVLPPGSEEVDQPPAQPASRRGKKRRRRGS